MTDDERTMLTAFWEEGIPFNASLRMKVTMIEEGEAEMMVASRPELTGDPSRPALHGGVVSALADAAAVNHHVDGSDVRLNAVGDVFQAL